MARLDRLKLLRERFAEVKEEAVKLERWLCGTQSCLLGFACTIPEFREAGLYMDPLHEWPTFDGYTCFEAGAAFFEISWEGANALFCARGDMCACDGEGDEDEEGEFVPDPDVTDKQVALNRLNDLIARLEGSAANGQQT